MANSNILHLVDGQTLTLYNSGNVYSSSIAANTSTLDIGGTGMDVRITSGNLIFSNATTIKGTSSAITIGASGDTVNLNATGVTYNVGALTGPATFSGNVTMNNNLTVSGTLSPTTITGTVTSTDLVLSYSRDSDWAKISFINYGSNMSWLTFDFGDDPSQDRARFRFNGTTTILDVISDQLASSVPLNITTSANTPAIKLSGAQAGWGTGIQLNNTTTTTGRNYGVYSASDGTFHFSDNTASADRFVVDTTGRFTFNQMSYMSGTLQSGTAANDYTPTTGNYSSGGVNILLNALDYSSIGFHDSGNRVDFIRSGGGVMEIGYDGGWGQPDVKLPGTGVWKSSGSVGIGVASPSAKLHINEGLSGSSTGYELILQSGSDSGSSPTSGARHGIEFRGTSTNVEARITSGNFGSYYGGLIFETKNTSTAGTTTAEMMRINYDGKVGIGTNAPSYLLDVNGTARITNYLYVSPDNSQTIEGGELQLVGAGSYGTVRLDNYQGNFRIMNPSGPIMLVDTANSRIGINTQSPSQALDITGSMNVSLNATIGGTATIGTINFSSHSGDPSPVITSRTMPSAQGGISAEQTEMIFFVANDPNNGAGPDTITLRSPAIRLQTYNDSSVADIANNAGSNTRLDITPEGYINMNGGIFITGQSGGAYREGGKFNLPGRLSGRIINRNADFIASKTTDTTITGFAIYDNGASNRLALSIVSDDTIPNSTGKLMRVSYDPYRNASTATSPGYAGFYINSNPGTLGRTTGNPTTWGWRAGNRYLLRLVARVPSGKSVYFDSNATGTGYSIKYLTTQVSAGDWQEYVAIQTTGNVGTMSNMGYVYVNGSPVGAYSTTWTASTAYAAGVNYMPATANGFYYKVTTAGTSGTAAPTWPTTANATVTDGTVVWTAYADPAFTWDVASYQIVALDEVPDVDRAPTLNVGYKSGVDLGWGEIYSTGKITTDLSLNGASLNITGSGGLPNTIQSGSGSGVLSVYAIGDGYGSGTVLWVKNDSTNTNNNYARFTADANGTPVHFLDIMYAGTNQVTFNNTAGGGINLNGGAVTTGSTLTVGGANLTINKSGNWSYISFAPQTSDRGFIGHYENSNSSEMRFVVSDDPQDDIDFFSFGAQSGTTTTIAGIQAGSWTEGARVTASGKITAKGLTINGATALNGTITTTTGITIPNSGSSTDGKGITFANGTTTSRVSTAAGTDVIVQANELRLGTSGSAWSYNQWAGLKYDYATTTMVIGGPAAFVNNGTPSRITFNISGTDAVGIDGKVIINPVNAASIALTTMANGYLLLGTTTSGMAFDPNEIMSIGNIMYVGTIDGNALNLVTNGSTRMSIAGTGNVGIGTTSPSSLLHVAGNAKITGTIDMTGSSAQRIYMGGVSAGTFGIAYDTTNPNYGLFYTEGTPDKIVLAPDGGGTNGTAFVVDGNKHVGIGTNPHSSYALNVTGSALFSDWVRTSGNVGWYSESYGGGWNMTDSTWIRAYGSKSVYLDAGTLRTDGDLQVGSSGATLRVINNSTLNFRNTIWSDGNHTAIRKTSSAHSLDVYSNIAWEGINLQTSDDTLSMGYSFQNSGGAYVWNMSRVNSSTASYPDLVFYGGNSSTQSGLSEVVRLYHSKGMKVQGNTIIAGNSALNHDPAITLALGDSDTGFNWTADGTFDVKSNSTSVINITSGQIQYNVPVYNNASHFSLAAASGRGFRFWNSDSYKIHMSAANDGSWGGTVPWIANTATGLGVGTDYNMYFRMNSSSHGWAFQSVSQGTVAQITPDGEMHATKGYRAKNFAMEYNVTEDSLDFVYYG